MRSISFRVTVLACVALAVTGLALTAYGHSLPVYTVPYEQAFAAFDAWCTPAARVDHAAGDRYLALFGWHYALMNAGSAVAAAALTTAALVLALRIGAPERPWFRTPANRWMYFLLGIVALLSYVPGIIHGLSLDLDRRYFPVCADSIGIPITGLGVSLTVLTPILTLIGIFISTGFGALPVPLMHWNRGWPVRSWGVTIVFGGAMLSVVMIAALSILSSDLTAPSSVIIVYLLASTRAALLAPREGTVPQSDP
ncbi:MAG: hypothetical protein KF730_01525 [Sphingomonas sp.]|uniref:hypothetical protein n=1 Tax=Sphingomonas sp. TaxID=28214 RepID=UPI0025D124E2|nr:hypothetical protein [Sphingomonas sp.]MBX3563233.1 hypothetical protein [Sphingomonas sp.]